MGGQLNAFTSKECTCFYAKVVDADLPLAIDVLSDLVTAPKFDPVELEKEKGVVVEEIAMAEDSPEDVVHELIMLAHFGDQPVARPILGSEARVSRLHPRRISTPTGATCTPPRDAVLAIAGRYDWEQVWRWRRSTCFPGTRASAMRAIRRPTPYLLRACGGKRTWSR